MIEGTILKGIGGFYYVSTASGVYECRARGIFRKENKTPTVGDHVLIKVLDDIQKTGRVDVLKDRRSFLIRPRVANVDQAVIVFAAKSPDINLDLLDRFIVLAEEQYLEILICINKIDLDLEKKYLDVLKIYSEAGFKILPLSTETGEGIEELKGSLLNKISVLAGPSGVGKSSLINSFAPAFKLQTGVISKKIERGKHTTRHAELMEFLPESFIVDTPGFTSLMLDHIKAEHLSNYFREFAPFIGHCRFNQCCHLKEPDCSVKAAVGSEISKHRYNRYVFLYNELNQQRRN